MWGKLRRPPGQRQSRPRLVEHAVRSTASQAVCSPVPYRLNWRTGVVQPISVLASSELQRLDGSKRITVTITAILDLIGLGSMALPGLQRGHDWSPAPWGSGCRVVAPDPATKSSGSARHATRATLQNETSTTGCLIVVSREPRHGLGHAREELRLTPRELRASRRGSRTRLRSNPRCPSRSTLQRETCRIGLACSVCQGGHIPHVADVAMSLLGSRRGQWSDSRLLPPSVMNETGGRW